MTVKESIAITTQWQLERKFVPRFNRIMLVQQMLHNAGVQVEHLKNSPQLEGVFLQYVQEEYINDQQIITYEDFAAIPLQQLQTKNLSAEQIIFIAQNIVNACIAIHQQGLIVQQLNDTHIFIDPKSLQVKLVPSSALSKWRATSNFEQPLHALQYLAPEQTGRIQLEVDERVDLYAIGAVLYQLFGAALFEVQSRDELFFQIVTKTPNVEHIAIKKGCEKLAQIITKLLMKNPSDRYQSALALKYDLQLLADNKLTEIAAGGQRFFPKLSAEIFGRQQELSELQEAFEQVVKGQKALVSIQGPSGIGKTAFVQQLKPNITAANGYFVDYKFEERHQHDMEAIILPLRQLLKQLYFKGNGAVQQFKDNIAQLNFMVTDNFLLLVPELRVLLDKGVQIAHNDVDFTKQQNTYFFTAIEKLLQAIALQKCPIVICIDDCQWASNNAVDAILRIFEQQSVGYVGIILTARNETQNTLQQLVTMERFANNLTAITLQQLQMQDVLKWLQQSIVMQDSTLQEVAQQLYEHTGGNPLFLQEIFKALLKNGAFQFHEGEHVWTVNEALFLQIVEKSDLIDFIVGRIQFLSLEAQRALKQIACIGRVFPLTIVQHTCALNEERLRDVLDELVATGFIAEGNSSYRGFDSKVFHFVHDRIHETAYRMLIEDEQQRQHHIIAQFLVEQQKQELLLPIVEQFKLSGPYVTETEKIDLVKWNYELGLLSKNAGLYDEALRYFLSSKALLPDNHWTTLQSESTNIYMYIGECSFLSGQYEQSERYIKEALLYANTSLEKLKIYRVMTFLYFESEDSKVVLEAGYLAFQECGIKLPLKPQKHHVLQEYVKLKWAMKNKTNETLLQLRKIEKQEIDLLLQIIVNIISSSFRLDTNLTGVLLLRSMRLMLQYGIVAESAIVLVNYAIMLAAGFNDTKEASRFGRLAVDLANQQSNAYIKTRVYFAYGTFIHYWENDYDSSKQYIQSAQHFAQQCGLNSVVNAASCFSVAAQWLQGKSLTDTYNSICFEQSTSNHATVLAKDYLQECRMWVEGLQHKQALEWDYPYQLKDEHAVVVMHHILRLQMSYFWQHEQQAHEQLDILHVPIRESLNLMTAPLYFLYRSLWQFDWLKADQLMKANRQQYIVDIKKSLKTFKKWAAVSPQNFEHLYTLLLAEYFRYKGQDVEAISYYERAIQLAEMHEFIVDAAIANERFAKYYAQKNDAQKSEHYYEQAMKALQQWGATAIVAFWNKKGELADATTITADASGALNLQTVLETTQSLAKEIRMEDLLQKLLYTLLKHCNATACYFIRQGQQGLSYTAKVEAQKMAFEYRPEGEVLEPAIEMMAQFVLQCDEPVLIRNVQQNALFAQTIVNAKSILCLPVHHNGDVIAVLYLENQVLHDAFNREQLQLIQMVATQIAVSLENVSIYEGLERRVEERTRQYEEMTEHLMHVNGQLERNELERKKLFKSISQELRAPIISSLGYIESVLYDFSAQSNNQLEHLQQSKGQLMALNDLITDLFDLTKLESGRYEFKLTYISARELYELATETFKQQVEAAGLQIQAHYQCANDSLLKIDVDAILQVLANILSNAIKYMERGHITLTFEVTTEQFICTVEDTGIGIKEEELPLIFDSYYIGHNHEAGRSYGIGLAICRQIIEQHGGQIMVTSKVDAGTCIRFTLPLPL